MTTWQYLTYLRKQWRIALAVSVTLAALAFLTYRPSDNVFTAETNFIVGQTPLQSTLTIEEERYFTWVTSEYVVFSLADWATGSEFAELISDDLQVQGIELSAEEVSDIIETSAVRSRFIMGLRHDVRSELVAVAAAASNRLVSLDGIDIPQLRLAPPQVVAIDDGLIINETEQTLQDQLAVPLRFLFGILGGLAVTWVLALNDPTIHSRDNLQSIGLPLLGEIPRGNL